MGNQSSTKLHNGTGVGIKIRKVLEDDPTLPLSDIFHDEIPLRAGETRKVDGRRYLGRGAGQVYVFRIWCDQTQSYADETQSYEETVLYANHFINSRKIIITRVPNPQDPGNNYRFVVNKE